MPRVRSFAVLPALPENLKDLEVIAHNVFWSWNPEFVALFTRIDQNLWEKCSHNPIKFLGEVSQNTLDKASKNKGYVCELKRAAEKLNNYLAAPTWFDQICSKQATPVIAYFSAEFGLHESLPIYSGGLGVLAGDHLKSASDLGVPIHGVGLMYQKGYFRQYLNIDGWQQEVYVDNDFYNMPMSLMRHPDGQPLTISVQYPQRLIFAQIWEIKVGRVNLYLLDTNIQENSPEDRLITANLYGGDSEMRIKQEILLGIGGLRALLAMDIKPTVCHMNEGHAAFMALERIRQLRSTGEMTFLEAAEATRAGNVFTVHTPVKAGNDEFSLDIMDKYFGGYYPHLGLSRKDFLALGRIERNNNTEAFKMPVLAMTLSAYRNGVSALHGKVSRQMWSGIWPGLPEDEVPIDSITNGVHLKTWLSEEMDSLYERYLGQNWTEDAVSESLWQNIEMIPDEEIWRTHQRGKGKLIAFSRKRLKEQCERRGTYHTELNWADEVLNPDALTIGFARRFASYKRGNLFLKDTPRLMKMLCDNDKPVQFIFAGKAHPRDHEGKEIIRSIIHFAGQYKVRKRIVFLEDYDIDVARYLVQGVDIWLNNPRPPMEASGTSGMKAAFNGALNFSTWDGWWCEGYEPQAGWTIGAGEHYDDPAYQDMVESKAMYNILENEIIPLYYSRAKDNLPRAWIYRMKKAIKTITPRFNTNRMVSEYAEKFYNNAAQRWKVLTANDMEKAKALAAWKLQVREVWNEIKIQDVNVKVQNDGQSSDLDVKNPQLKVGSELSVDAIIKLPVMAPENICTQIYYGPVDPWGNISDGKTSKMRYVEKIDDQGRHRFTGSIPCKNSGKQGLIVRILPSHDDLVNPHEMGLVTWESTENRASVTV